MTKLRTGDPWMPAPDYGRTLEGLGINLLVREIEPALPFHRAVLDAEVVYGDPDIAVLRREGVEWMLHAHHTYDSHPWHSTVTSDAKRGIGVELRLHGRDPDAAESAARRLGFEIIQSATDKPHGLREAYIVDRDGYVWVPDVPIT